MLFCILGEHTNCQGEGYSWNWLGQEGYLGSQVRIYVINVLRDSYFFIFFPQQFRSYKILLCLFQKKIKLFKLLTL